MDTINGIDLVLLFLGLVAAYGWWWERQGVQATWERGFIAGRNEGVDQMMLAVTRRDVDRARKGCYRDVTRTSHPREPYDWKRDGL